MSIKKESLTNKLDAAKKAATKSGSKASTTAKKMATRTSDGVGNRFGIKWGG